VPSRWCGGLPRFSISSRSRSNGSPTFHGSGWIDLYVGRLRLASNRTHLNSTSKARVTRVVASLFLLALAFSATSVVWGAIDIFRHENFLGVLWDAVLSHSESSVPLLLAICAGWVGWIVTFYTVLHYWLI
jgi:hypothetical protein